jgi:hypothetical protein
MMNIVDFLSELATVMPNSNKSNGIIKLQPKHIQKAITTSDSELLKQYISNTPYCAYAHETKVTLY